MRDRGRPVVQRIVQFAQAPIRPGRRRVPLGRHLHPERLNQQDATFRDVALGSGVALGASGNRKADMGVDAGDFDNDGDEDLVITELTGQGSTLYVNDGTGVFEERSGPVGVRLASLPFTGFGAGWIDFDNDGWLDILEVNGSVTQNYDALGPDNPFPMQQPNLLLRNLSGQTFEDVTGRAGAAFERSEVSRGAAFGDIDNDGDTDVVIANAEGPVRLLVNHRHPAPLDRVATRRRTPGP